MKKFITSSLALSFLISCNSSAPEPQENGEGTNTTAPKAEPLKGTLEELWETDTLLTTNESVLYNPEDGLLYVSCIAGQPTNEDGVGFIAKVKANGHIAEQKWAEGLSAPKGMAILNGKLYVTDINRLVAISLEDPSQREAYPVEGAIFLNDVTVLNDRVFFSDMQTGKIHQLENNTVSTLIENRDGINGLTVVNGKLYGLDGMGFHAFPLDGSNPQTINRSFTGGDGLEHVEDSTFIASRWQGEIWLLRGSESYKMLDSKADEVQTADLGYFPKKRLVLVPRFFSNKVTAMRLNY